MTLVWSSAVGGGLTLPDTDGIYPSIPVQLFDRILKEPDDETPAAERRNGQRFSVGPKFPLKSVLSFIGRDEDGNPLSSTRAGWHWKGRMINFSEKGARVQLAPSIKVSEGDSCDLKLSLETYDLQIPCYVTNVRDNPEGVMVGLKHEAMDEETATAYRQLLDTVALGVTLKLDFKKAKPDDTGYLTEQYTSPGQSCLKIWRYHPEKTVGAFELLLQDCLVRGADDRAAEFLVSTATGEPHRTSGVRLWEIQRLYRWVVPNLGNAVPADVRNYLEKYVS